MLSEIAKHDLLSLRACGINPTDEEIIKLNDLGNRIEHGKATTVVNHPRTATAGSIVLHEPTVGGVEWWEVYGKDAFILNSSRLYGYFFMLAHCRDIGYLSSLRTSKDISKAVKRWKRTIDATEDELWRAMLYVKFGYDVPEAKDNQKPDEQAVDLLWRKLIMVSGATNIKPDDLKTCVDSELTGMLVQASIQARLDLRPSIAELYLDYKRTLREIEDRHYGKR